jgi:hypothetical protein
MNMSCPRLALWLLSRADAPGIREALIGDLIEEIARGRPRRWAWRQVVGLFGVALVAHARRHARVTPHLVALALATVLLGGVSIVPLVKVLEIWVGLYLVAGTLSLFAHVISRTTDPLTVLIPADSHGGEPR